MATIDAASTLQDLFDLSVANFQPSTADFSAWKSLPNNQSTNTLVTIDVGLTGIDLTKFLADCTTVTLCDENSYGKYSGFAIAGSFQAKSAVPNGSITAFVFGDSFDIVAAMWDTTNSATGSKATAASAAIPGAAGDVTANDGVGPFLNYFAIENKSLSIVALHFQNDDDAHYREVGDAVDIWATGDFTVDNVANTAFVLAGAA